MPSSIAIDIDRFSWSRPLVIACLRHYPSVASLFAGDPTDTAAWARTIARVQQSARDREAVGATLLAQLSARHAPSPAIDAASRLSNPATVAVVTGQQAGLFGGPLYTLLKAITTIQLARRVEREHGVPAVPVFWVEAEDHDWKEIRSARILDAEQSVREFTTADLPGAGQLPVCRLTFDEQIAATVAALSEALPPTAFTDDLRQRLAQRYRSGVTPVRAFAEWMDALFGEHGLVVFEANDPAAKPLVAHLFAAEIGNPARTARLASEAAHDMKALGHAPQIEPAADSVALFSLDAAGRVPIKWNGQAFTIAGRTETPAALAAEAANHPERFSPNVLLRPLVQDSLFPTICYVAGPSELAYHAQLGRVYDAFGVARPLLMPRVSATLMDSAASRFLERHALTLDAICLEEDTALSRLVARALPVDVEDAIAALQQAVTDRGSAVKHAIASIDPTLAGAVDTTLERMRDTLKSLQGKVVQAAKRNDETLRRQFKRTYTLVYPGAAPQERTIASIFFLNRYGPGLIPELMEALPLDTSQHYAVTL